MAERAAASPARKRFLGGALAGLLAGGAALAADLGGYFEAIEGKSLDWRQRWAAGREAAEGPRPVAIVYQGEPSLAAGRKLGREWSWPWARSLWRPVLDLIRRDGARAAAFDVVFSEASSSPDEDAELEAGLRDLGTMHLATMFAVEAPVPLPEGALARVRELAVTVTAGAPGDLAIFPEAQTIHSLSEEIFLRAAAGIGNVAHPSDRDGIFRRVAPLVRFEGRFYPTIALAVAHRTAGGGPIRLESDRTLVYGSGEARRRVPIEPDGTILIRFGRAAIDAHEEAVEAFDAIMAGAEEGELVPKGLTYRPGAFRDRIVFIGYSAVGTYDLKPLPILVRAPGVLFHVAAAENLLSGRTLRTWTRRSPLPLAAAVLLLGAATGALVASTPSVLRQILCALGLGALWLGLAVLVAFPRDLVIDVVSPEAAILLAFTGGSVVNYVTEGRQRKQIKDAFQHYLNPTFVDELLRDPTKLRLGGERRELTIFFSDLAGFTTMSEKLTPEDLVKVLNGYLTRMTRIILNLGGTHDKYIGDAVMCFYGAPLKLSAHATLACIGALEQQAEIIRLNVEYKALGLPTVLARMGINTGEVVVGYMGSDQTMDYSVMGDAVNLASRLEGANKPFGTLIMAGERTEAQARGDIDFRELAGLQVKGKTRPVKVYEVLGRKGATPPGRLAAARRFEAALRLFEARRFVEAAAEFEGLAAKEGDEPSKLYLEECRAFAAEPPGADWDGVVTLTSK